MGEVRGFVVVQPGGAGLRGVEFPGGQVVGHGMQGAVAARDMGTLLATMPGSSVAWTGGAGLDVTVLEDWRQRAELERHQRGGCTRGWVGVWAAAETVLGVGGGEALPWVA